MFLAGLTGLQTRREEQQVRSGWTSVSAPVRHHQHADISVSYYKSNAAVACSALQFTAVWGLTRHLDNMPTQSRHMSGVGSSGCNLLSVFRQCLTSDRTLYDEMREKTSSHQTNSMVKRRLSRSSFYQFCCNYIVKH